MIKKTCQNVKNISGKVILFVMCLLVFSVIVGCSYDLSSNNKPSEGSNKSVEESTSTKASSDSDSSQAVSLEDKNETVSSQIQSTVSDDKPKEQTRTESETESSQDSVTKSESLEESTSSAITVSSDSENSSNIKSEESNAENDLLDGIKRISASDIKVTHSSDYAHISNDIIILGINESAQINVSLEDEDLSLDDIYFDYDESLLNVETSEEKISGHTRLKAIVTGKTECDTEISIFTCYDYLVAYANESDSCDMYTIKARQLDQIEGSVVYVTPTGEKYHRSKSCAGENYTITTYHDATCAGYESCRKCS